MSISKWSDRGELFRLPEKRHQSKLQMTRISQGAFWPIMCLPDRFQSWKTSIGSAGCGLSGCPHTDLCIMRSGASSPTWENPAFFQGSTLLSEVGNSRYRLWRLVLVLCRPGTLLPPKYAVVPKIPSMEPLYTLSPALQASTSFPA